MHPTFGKAFFAFAAVLITVSTAGCVVNPTPAPAGASPSPYLRIEVGEHTGTVRRLAVDRSERWLVTASDDKTARVWDLKTGKLERILRPRIGVGDEGKLYAVAVSPNGEHVALGGHTGPTKGGHPIYVFERATGRLLGRSAAFADVANHLTYSADGRRLAAVFGPRLGLRILDAFDLTHELTRDDRCRAEGHGADFDNDGTLAATCADGTLRVYDATGDASQADEFKLDGDDGNGKPYSVEIRQGNVFSPFDYLVLVGLEDKAFVQTLHYNPKMSSDSLRYRGYRELKKWRRADTLASNSSDGRGNRRSIAMSRDGDLVYAAGTYQRDGIHEISVVPWSKPEDDFRLQIGPNPVSHLVGLSQSRVAYASGAEWGVRDSRGNSLREVASVLPDLRRNAGELRLSDDGLRVEFGIDVWDGKQWKMARAQFDLSARLLATGKDATYGLHSPRTTGLAVSDWKAGGSPKLNGRTFAKLLRGEESRSLDVALNGSSFALGTNVSLRIFDALGVQRWERSVSGGAWAVNQSRDGRFVVAALGDGTVRWFDAATGTERFALFVHAQDKRWVLFTPEGFYQAWGGGDAMIGYHWNQGDNEAEFIDSAQLAGVFFRPDLISRRLAGDEIAIAQAVTSIGDVRAILAAGLPPTLELLSPAEAEAGSDGEYELKVRITEGAGEAGIGEIKLFINDAEVSSREISPLGGGVVSQRLRLVPGDKESVVSMRVMRGDGKVASNEVRAKVRVKASDELPVLRVLAVGISQYKDATFAKGVRFAAQDAGAFVTQMRAGAEGVYRDTDIRLLNSPSDTGLARIDAELQELVKRSSREDVVVIYFAGHGKAPEGKQYHFIPADFLYDNDQAFNPGKTLTQARLEELLKNLGPGKRLLILDTCDSGTVAMAGRGDGASEQKDALARLMRNTGRYILAAASPQGKALEDGVNGHGVYTAALLEGMRGAANTRNEAMIEVDALADYVSRRVPELTSPAGYEQRPMRSAKGENFPFIRRIRTQ